jgi:hypothetical protein
LEQGKELKPAELQGFRQPRLRFVTEHPFLHVPFDAYQMEYEDAVKSTGVGGLEA